MHRCLQLAILAEGNTAPNPMVGAVLVYNNRIIGEGYHQRWGEAHAEVHCIQSVQPEHEHLISEATIYVSLEPCAHFGKTPPCADLIIKHKIPKVVVGCRDPFVAVDGKGIERLKAAGIDVTVGVLEEECKELNKRFFTFHIQKRPFVVLKWAQTGDGKMAAIAPPASGPANLQAELFSNRLFISNQYSNRLVHQWRNRESSILIGTRTAVLDDPELTTRLWPGNNPVRLVIDINLQLPHNLRLFNSAATTIVFNRHKHTLPLQVPFAVLKEAKVYYYQVTEDVNLVHQVMNALYQLNILSVLVEGGSFLLQSFIDEGLWDEACTITNEGLIIQDGLPAPVLKKHQLITIQTLQSDVVRYYKMQEGTLLV